jgi:hypothetical protein
MRCAAFCAEGAVRVAAAVYRSRGSGGLPGRLYTMLSPFRHRIEATLYHGTNEGRLYTMLSPFRHRSDLGVAGGRV